MVRVFLILAAVLTVSACSSTPQIVSGTPENVSYRIRGNDVAHATQQALKYCGQFQRSASLRQVVNERGDTVATYDCV